MNTLREPFDPRAFELRRRAEADPDAAAELLQLAVAYLRNRKPLPPMLADYIADAFESAALKPRDYRAKQLTDELNLTANNRRKVQADWLDAYEVLIGDSGISKNAAANKLKEKTGIGKTKADELIEKASKLIEEIGNSP